MKNKVKGLINAVVEIKNAMIISEFQLKLTLNRNVIP